jgi:pimeloyl-ACP methyl ester carboxylesterase
LAFHPDWKRTMHALRTADERFIGLPGYDYAPHYAQDLPEFEGLRLHYVDAGARGWWRSEWQGRTFMAIGMKDPVFGAPVMHALRKTIRGCPQAYEHPDAGHFVQVWGADIAQRALGAFV